MSAAATGKETAAVAEKQRDGDREHLGETLTHFAP